MKKGKHNDFTQEELSGILGSNENICLQSGKHIKRYANMDGKEYQPFAIANFVRAIEKDLHCNKINPDTDAYKVVKHIHSQLSDVYNENVDCESITIELADKEKYLHLAEKHSKANRLGFWPHMVTAAISEGARHLAHKTLFKSVPMAGVDETETVPEQKNKNGLPDHFVRADNRKVVKAPDTFRLKGEVGNYLQDIQPYKYSIVLTGDSGAGKTETACQIINAFCSAGKRVGFYSLEQGGLESKDTKAPIDRNITPANQKLLSVTGEAKRGIETIKSECKYFDVIAIDSWQKLKIPSTKFDDLRHEFPNKIWIVIFQQNGEGGTRGGVSADFDSPVHIKVHKVDETRKNNYAELIKNRGNQIGLQYMVVAKKLRKQKK